MVWKHFVGSGREIPWDEVDSQGRCNGKEADVDNDHLGEILGRLFECTVLLNASVQQIIRALESGHPVVVNFLIRFNEQDHDETNPDFKDFWPIDTFPLPEGIDLKCMDGHYCVVVGYEDSEDGGVTLILNDPLRGRTKIAEEEFVKLWRAYYSHHVGWMAIVQRVNETYQQVIETLK